MRKVRFNIGYDMPFKAKILFSKSRFVFLCACLLNLKHSFSDRNTQLSSADADLPVLEEEV